METSKGSALVIDDDRTNRELLAQALRQADFTVSLAAGGEEALAGGRDYDVVLSDLKMAPLSGLDVLDAFRKTAPETPVILPFDKVGQVDQPIALIAQSRNAFYSGKLDDAHVHLNSVKRLKPNMYEASLLEAEYFAAEGEPAKAGLLTRSLTSDLSVPQWIRIYAEEIQKRLPQ